MEVSNNLKKQIIIEIFVLLLMASVAVYAYFALGKNNNSTVVNENGIVLVLDDSKVTNLKKLSDGKGLEGDYVRYTITNNNSDMRDLKLIIIPSIKDEKVLENIRVGVNDIYINDLGKLEKVEDGYLLDSFNLSPGVTRNYLFKYWYKLNTDDINYKDDIKFEYKVILDS